MEKGTVLDATETERILEDALERTRIVYGDGEPWERAWINTPGTARELALTLERTGYAIVRKDRN